MCGKSAALICGVLFLVSVDSRLFGQTAAVKPDAVTTPAPTPSTTIKVVPKSSAGIAKTQSAGLGGAVTVPLEGLDVWAKSGNDPNTLRLVVMGRMLDGCEPILVNPEENYLNFRLDLKPEDRDKWVNIFTETIRSGKYDVLLSVGQKGTNQPFQSRERLHLQVYPDYTVLVIFVLAAMFLVVLWLGYATDLLRDGLPTEKGKRPITPLSLGKTQMAWWFYLVIATYVYIWIITGDYNTPNGSVLTLIGISSTTGLAATFLDRNKTLDATKQRRALEVQEAALSSRVAQIQLGSPPTGSPLDQEMNQKQNQISEVHEQLARLDPVPPPRVSQGFLRDLLGDESGISIHRFQMAVWTIILGFVFIRAVSQQLAMPQFDSGLLGLLGISSGTYIGFKFPEQAK